MLKFTLRMGLAAALLSPLGFGVRAGADQIAITVTDAQPAGGFGISPVWLGLSDGSFPAFAAGDDLKGSPYQSAAELANTGPITAAFAGLGPQVTSILDVADPATTRFLNDASMIVPSNDFFFANDRAHTLTLFNAQGQLIDAAGQATTERTIAITGAQAWDAGTEVNNASFGAAFLPGVDINDHVVEGGRAALVFGGGADNSGDLASLRGKQTLGGYPLTHLITAGDTIATIRTQAVPEPGSLRLLGIGAAGVAVVVRRRRGERGAA